MNVLIRRDACLARRSTKSQTLAVLTSEQCSVRANVQLGAEPKVIYNALGEREVDVILSCTEARADRYGGRGIGVHGGSGRAGVIAGHYVKGIGPTPLIGSNADIHHRSGRLYLEEAIREAIFSQIFLCEAPFGAVPVTAIALSGLTESWVIRGKERREYCALSVRPPFLRPAHFTSARNFRTSVTTLSTGDAVRVEANWNRIWGDSELNQYLDDVFEWGRRAVQQITWSHVWCLQHLAVTHSNMTIDGEFLDFGAASAVPGYGTIISREGQHNLSGDLAVVLEIIRDLLSPQFAAGLNSLITTRYNNFLDEINVLSKQWLAYEMLRLWGCSDQKSENVLADKFGQEIMDLLAHFWRQAENNFYYFDFQKSPSGQTHFGQPISTLAALEKVASLLPSQFFSKSASSFARLSSLEDASPSLNLGHMYRLALKKRVSKFLDKLESVGSISPAAITSFINRSICRARRRSRHLPPDFITFGFLHAETLSAALVKDYRGTAFLWLEDRPFELLLPTQMRRLLPIKDYSSTWVSVEEEGRVIFFQGAVYVGSWQSSR